MERNNQAAPNDIENPQVPLEYVIKKELGSLPILSPWLCIYKVPERLRCVTEKMFTPKVISIGPLHHGKKGLKAMEEYKKRYLNDFLERTELSLEHCIKKVKDQEARLRSCYADPFDLSSDEFVRIILLDAVFIIELLLRCRYYELYDENDRIFNKPWMYVEEVWPDMLLLENQLPLFILDDLFDPSKVIKVFDDDHREHGRVNIISLSYDFFGTLMHIEGMERNFNRVLNNGIDQPKHFVDLWRHLYVPPQLPPIPQLLPIRGKKVRLTTLRTPSMTELYWAGVTFKVRPTNELPAIGFRNSTLEIPKLAIGNEIGLLFRNMLAFEQCHCRESCINDYVAILDRLARTPKDVALLVEQGIVEDRVGDINGVSTLINNLVAGVIMDPNYFLFADLCDELSKYCTAPWSSWRATWGQYLYNKRWQTFSISAVFILLLTIIQTVCSIISLKHK